MFDLYAANLMLNWK